MEFAIGVLAGGYLISIGVMGIAIGCWRDSSRYSRDLARDNERLCNNLHTQREINDELRRKLERYGALADELRGIDREDD